MLYTSLGLKYEDFWSFLFSLINEAYFHFTDTSSIQQTFFSNWEDFPKEVTNHRILEMNETKEALIQHCHFMQMRTEAMKGRYIVQDDEIGG